MGSVTVDDTNSLADASAAAEARQRNLQSMELLILVAAAQAIGILRLPAVHVCTRHHSSPRGLCLSPYLSHCIHCLSTYCCRCKIAVHPCTRPHTASKCTDSCPLPRHSDTLHAQHPHADSATSALTPSPRCLRVDLDSVLSVAPASRSPPGSSRPLRPETRPVSACMGVWGVERVGAWVDVCG